eukprot:GHRR01031679.1.p1 GENE.GHRR01031679.1~~GHRR01031679.1.p1  ORF type:complete len:154 (+),score=26.81 GHRR01031679.1:60-464(+)
MPAAFAVYTSSGGVLSVRYSVINGLNRLLAGMAAVMRCWYACAYHMHHCRAAADHAQRQKPLSNGACRTSDAVCVQRLLAATMGRSKQPAMGVALLKPVPAARRQYFDTQKGSICLLLLSNLIVSRRCPHCCLG